MRLTILHALVLLVLPALPARSQTPELPPKGGNYKSPSVSPVVSSSSPVVSSSSPVVSAFRLNERTDKTDPFGAGAWHFETDATAALEAWNYNISHEELYGFSQGVTYGVRHGLVVRAVQRLAYVSQRAEDAVLLGLTIGVRGRVYERGRLSVFLQGDVGISHTAIATPPRGTRFNYLALGGGGLTVRVRPRVHVVSSLQLIHVSNAGVKGPGRNPDIEGIGPTIGILVGF